MSIPAEISTLPIAPHLDDICAALRSSPSRFLVLTAQTAAGKSTAVPVALLHAFDGAILMLEPRRLAAVAIADRVAHLLGEPTGRTAGYRLHLESRVSAATRLEVMTEAILTRRLQQDPSLGGVSVVVLDEFHERSVHADLALAFLKEAMQLREDLYVVVMSATMDAKAVAAYLDDAPVFAVSGRAFPVTTSYRPNESPARAVLRELAGGGAPAATGATAATFRNDGILVFLPGIGDIRRTKQELEAALGTRLQDAGADGVQVLVLHSSVPLDEQRAVLSPQPSAAPRRVILASAIAETSLTVPGVATVIDSGWARLNRMNVAQGMERLVTERESLFSAEQRAGRAGRLALGRCVRLWNQFDALAPATPPEITRTDLVPLVLECAAWGARSPDKVDWLDSPAPAAWSAAQELLAQLGCIDGAGAITRKGTAALALGLHPRLACTVLAGLECGCLPQTTRCALRFSSYAQASPRQQQLFCGDLERRAHGCGVPAGVRRPCGDAELLLAGYPDRIGRRIEDGGTAYQFPSGRQAALAPSAAKGHAAPAYIVAPEVDAGSTTARIFSYEPLEDGVALAWLSARATVRTQVEFADGGKSPRLVKTERTAYGALVLKERIIKPSAEDFGAAVCAAVARHGIAWLPLNDAARSLLRRTRFFVRHAAEARAATEDAVHSLQARLDSLAAQAQVWLVPFLAGGGTSAPSAETVYDALYWHLDGQTVDRAVPGQIALANGKKRRLVYDDNGGAPVLEVIIQQIFGCFETPRVLGVPVLLHLLSPARRPLQITDDLAGFWQHTWAEICKEMKGRYPKHNWDYRVAQED